MENQPIISVIVSTYNRKKKLKRAINSILSQTFQQFEIIIVDDASTDGTESYGEKMMKKYPGKIVYHRIHTNQGQHGIVKNVGIHISKAPLIAFLDDDNEYLVDHLQVLYNAMTQQPLADIVYGDRWVVLEKDHKKKQKGISGDFNLQRLFVENYIDTSDFLIKRDALLAVGGWDEKLPKFADWNLFVRLAKNAARFLHVGKLITNYYVHDDMNQNRHPSKVDGATGRLLPTFNPASVKIWADQSTFGEGKSQRIAIFTLTMNRLEYTKKTLESLKKFALYPYDHFIVDNGSTDGTVEWLKANQKEFNIKELILNPENVGISKGSNQALDAIGDGYDVIVKIDNDCELQTEGLVAAIAMIFERNRRLIISPNVEGLIDNAGGVPRVGHAQMGPFLLGFVEHLGGISCAAPAEMYKIFRWKDEDFLHGMQDTIFSQAARQIGYTMAYLEDQRVMHIDSTYGQKEKFPEYFEKRKEEKITKYKAQ